MDHQAISQQVIIEHEILAHVTSALRTTLSWNYQATNLSRKVDSLRFVAESFDRHLKRLMALEEDHGYMTVVLESRPEVKGEVDTLRQEHVRFRKELNLALRSLDQVDPTDHVAFYKVSADLMALLDELDVHGRKETDLLQHVLMTDEGGEG